MMERKGFRVQGRVQGVGFRWWTRRLAQGLGLTGDVRNCADGSVEVQAAGDLEALEALEAGLWKGPPGSRVDSLSVIPPVEDALGPGFTIEGR